MPISPATRIRYRNRLSNIISNPIALSYLRMVAEPVTWTSPSHQIDLIMQLNNLRARLLDDINNLTTPLNAALDYLIDIEVYDAVDHLFQEGDEAPDVTRIPLANTPPPSPEPRRIPLRRQPTVIFEPSASAIRSIHLQDIVEEEIQPVPIFPVRPPLTRRPATPHIPLITRIESSIEDSSDKDNDRATMYYDFPETDEEAYRRGFILDAEEYNLNNAMGFD